MNFSFLFYFCKGPNEPRRGIKFNRYPIESLLQADAVEMMDINGEVFLITANEGAPLNYVCQSCEVETEYMEMEEAAELAGGMGCTCYVTLY